jgi:hypothetical protein
MTIETSGRHLIEAANGGSIPLARSSLRCRVDGHHSLIGGCPHEVPQTPQ